MTVREFLVALDARIAEMQPPPVLLGGAVGSIVEAAEGSFMRDKSPEWAETDAGCVEWYDVEIDE